jgi:hypothetical protein
MPTTGRSALSPWLPPAGKVAAPSADQLICTVGWPVSDRESPEADPLTRTRRARLEGQDHQDWSVHG